MPVTTAPSPTLSSRLLAGPADGSCVALVDASEEVTYRELRARIDHRGGELGLGERSLVILAGGNSLEWVVTYLALLDGGHVPLLTDARQANISQLASAWSPAATVTVYADDLDVRRHPIDRHQLHPELALLLSTSGSTGSPKLVRLSHRNLTSNADAIARYLRIDEHDRAITSLPMHYCYGLSVLHSHLTAGASVAVTDNSVVDPCFRSMLHERAVTNLAGVPHTFEMLERAGADRVWTRSLRFFTQAGGRLAPDAVARWVSRTRRWGADFFVMYGQTEATARMAYLPPHLAEKRPEAIGVPIPGGSLEIRPFDDPDAPDAPGRVPVDGSVGELVYRGDNVMMGYAVDRSDLALGGTMSELRTGDVARFHADDGVYEIIGRRARFVKPFGLRVDLDRVEAEIRREAGTPDIAVAGDDSRLVALAPEGQVDQVESLLAAITGLPAATITVGSAVALPRTSTDKIDYAAVMRAGDRPATTTPEAPTDVAEAFARVLGRSDIGPNDTFVSLGGDSLSYVECSIRLERLLGVLPSDWHLRPVSSLAASPASGSARHRFGRVDTTVLLRALGICLVVSTHMRLWHIPGGAHTMLAVAGYNLARFLAPVATTKDRLLAGARTAARAAVPAVLWTAGGLALGATYGLGTLLLVNNYVGPASHSHDQWHFWFIEVFVHLVLIATLLLAVPPFRRAERRFPYAVPVAVLLLTLLLRLEWAQAGDWYNLRFRTHGVAWFLVLGWVIHQSQAWWQRLATTALCLAIVPGFFRIDRRDWMIALALIALVWLRDVPVPRIVIRPIGIVAAASMWIYISHFTFWPPLDDLFVREAAYLLTLASGVAVWLIAERLLGLLNKVRQPNLRRSGGSRAHGALTVSSTAATPSPTRMRPLRA